MVSLRGRICRQPWGVEGTGIASTGTEVYLWVQVPIKIQLPVEGETAVQ